MLVANPEPTWIGVVPRSWPEGGPMLVAIDMLTKPPAEYWAFTLRIFSLLR